MTASEAQIVIIYSEGLTRYNSVNIDNNVQRNDCNSVYPTSCEIQSHKYYVSYISYRQYEYMVQ